MGLFDKNQLAQTYAEDFEVPKVGIQPTLRRKLEMDIKHLEEVLSKKREMLALLDSNPAIEQFMDLSRY
jgi:energy-converting hydrogenase A subunit M